MAIELRYRIVDVFSDRPLAGNALCVVFDPCPEPVMPAVAREVNLAETVFVTPAGEGEYDARIFTPTAEFPFAGHPTLGAAWTLGPGRWTQHTSGGSVGVDVDEAGATMSQPDPKLYEVHWDDAAGALAVRPKEAIFVAELVGIRHVMVATDDPVEHVRADLQALRSAARNMNASGVAVFRPVDNAVVHARVFIPESPVPEDPGTGSAAGPIGLLTQHFWGLGEDLVIHQGDEMGRPCRIRVHVEQGNMRVGGDVSACAEGVFTL